MSVCSVCKKEEAAYKCPKCILPYLLQDSQRWVGESFCFAKLDVESCEPADAKHVVPETPLELDVAEPLLRLPEVVKSPPVESLTPLQQQVLSSSQVATLLGDPNMQAKIGGILEAQDPESALREAIQNDPDGVGRIASIIYGFIDQSSQ